MTGIFLSGCGSDDDSNNDISVSNPNTDNTGNYETRIAAYAELKEIPLDEAKRRLLVMDSAYESYPAIDEHLRDSVSSIYFNGDEDFGLTVRTTRKGELLSILDENLIKKIKDETGMLLRIKNNAVMNSDELQVMLSQKTEELSEKILGFQAMGYNPKKDSIIIKVYDPSLSSNEELSNKYSMKDLSGIDVEFQLLSAPISPAVLVGGGQLLSFNGSTPSGRCTAGFSAFASNGAPAIITAYHCLGRSKYSNGVTSFQYTDNNNVIHNLTPAYTRPSANHDMALLLAPSFTSIKAGVYLDDRFGSSPVVERGTKQSLKKGLFSTPAEEFLCHYGRKTGFSCGETKELYIGLKAVYNGVSLCNTDKTSCNSTFISLTGSDLKCSAGDSGGPVVSGYPVDNRGGFAAYGIVSACDQTLVRLGEDLTMYLSSLDFINELPATLALAP
nr:hypothetical protein [uncultured Psychrobacter sp.]